MYPPNSGENVCHQTKTEPGSSGRIPIRPSQRSPCCGRRPPRTSSLPPTNFQLEAGLEGWLAPLCVWRLSLRHQPGQAMAPHGACHRLYLCWACRLPHRPLLRARAGRREALEKRKLIKLGYSGTHAQKRMLRPLTSPLLQQRSPVGGLQLSTHPLVSVVPPGPSNSPQTTPCPSGQINTASSRCL